MAFDPTNPARFRGPSSTCAPEFSFADQGQTGVGFDATRLGDAADGPGLQGANGLGTWTAPVVDLSRFRGRRLRLRFLATGLKLGSVLHWEQIFVFNPDPRDDGWWIDDVRVTDALAEPADVGPDRKDNTALPSCGTGCQFVTAAVLAQPAATAAPGQVVVLNAAGSAVPRCIDGIPQYLFAVDVDRDGTFRRGLDVVLQDWADDETLLVTPQGATDYLAGVRCGTEPGCNDHVSVTVDVACPTGLAGLGSGSSGGTAFLVRESPAVRHVRFSTPDRLTWVSAATVDVLRGDLPTLRANGFQGAGEVTGCIAENMTNAHSVVVPEVPPPGVADFYLVRSAERCNQKAGGSWGQVGEKQPRDPGIAGAAAACHE